MGTPFNNRLIIKSKAQELTLEIIYLLARSLISQQFSVQQKEKSKNMDPNTPVVPPMSRPMPFPNMGQPSMPPMSQVFAPAALVPPGAMRPGQFPPPYINPIEAFNKVNEFNRGVYVSGFERTLTAAMLQQHFKIKPIAGLRLPLTKHNQNKGFAFVYYNTADDAAFVKQKLDYSVILRNSIRVTKTVVAENLSKMMFKLKKANLTEAQLKNVKQKFFNEKVLEEQVSAVINPIFGNNIQVNKIIIPHSKIDKKTPLDYARGFFYISNIVEASKIAKLQSTSRDVKKEQYEAVLNFIAVSLNNNPTFSKYVKAEIYEYANKNKNSVLHFKNINLKSDEDPSKVAEELKNFIQEHKRQVEIKGCFVGQFEKNSAWANVVFATPEQTADVYQHFKSNRIKFRDNLVYANIRNVKDLRTVVVSTVHSNADETMMKNFLNTLAQESTRVDPNDEGKGRKYDFASFNIIEEKTFYLNNDHTNVGLTKQQKAQESWRLVNSVPRRVVIHFLNEISQKDLRQLINDIKLKNGWDKIFFEKDRKTTTSATHQKGHIEDGTYIKHADPHKKKNEPQMQQKRDQRTQPNNRRNPMDQQQFHINKTRAGGAPKAPGQKNPFPQNPMRQGGFAPIAPTRPIGQFSSIPTVGSGNFNPKMSIPTPGSNLPMPQMGGMSKPGMMPGMGSMPMPTGMQMGGINIPAMGTMPMGGMNLPMGGMPPQMGGMPPPMGGMQPQMGGMQPPMGSMQPPIGAPKMGSNPTMPAQQKKQ